VADPSPKTVVEAPDFTLVASRKVDRTWVPGDAEGTPWVEHTALFSYLRAPQHAGTYPIRVRTESGVQACSIRVLGVPDLLAHGADLPRRWRVGKPWESTKTARTLEREELGWRPRQDSLQFWLTEPDEMLWRQIPPAELPKAHFVNEHHGCPSCGTRVFRHGGFYPWTRSHLPCTFLSTCPACSAAYPSNRLADGDYTSGSAVDDGYGYFDGEGRLYLFAATYHRDQLRAFTNGIAVLTDRLRHGPWDDEVARRLGLLLARYSLEELYVAAAPQFRYGPSKGVEEPWRWGQEDWMGQADPVAAFAAKGTLHYSIDTPHVARGLALAFDTVWPFLRDDEQLAERVRARGLPVGRPREVCDLVEQMLACLLQCILDFGARSNLPEESQGALMLLLALDRPDAQDVMEWLYRSGPDRLGVFCLNDFLPDGSPPESTGGYNSMHTRGLFALEHELGKLRARHPASYPESRFPSVLDPVRAARCILQPHELTVVGRSFFQFGDGSAPGTGAAVATGAACTSLLMAPEIHDEPLPEDTYRLAGEYLRDPEARAVCARVLSHERRALGTTVHDRVGIAILRTPEAPERAALGVAYGDAVGHRHMDLGDVQLFAWGRPFLTDLGYPQSWASIAAWEAHWATHNTAWAVVEGATDARIAGRGRIVSCVSAPGVQVIDLEMHRWVRAPGRGWRRLDAGFRRLLALVETDGEGIAVIDLSRAWGGVEHWRVCRGLEGTFDTGEVEGGAAELPPTRSSGPGDARRRTILEALAARDRPVDIPDYQAFAFFDDSRELPIAGFRVGSWSSSIEKGVMLDLHHLAASPGTELWSARATQTMGTPGESLYGYRALLWRRTAASPDDCSAVDLVLEPRLGAPTLASVRAIAARAADRPGSRAGSSPCGAAGVAIRTRCGKDLRLYWSPWATAEEKTVFEDGVTLEGTLRLDTGGATLGVPDVPRAEILGIDRMRNVVEVTATNSPAAGCRVRCARDGVGFTYLVRSAEQRGSRAVLTLDVSRVLGVSSIAGVGDEYVDLADPVITRTGYLAGARLVAGSPDREAVLAEVLDAANLDGQRTRLWLGPAGPAAPTAAAQTASAGQRVALVDYAVGDILGP
jgi:hypothetical protein